jgi:hypothetical protein
MEDVIKAMKEEKNTQKRMSGQETLKLETSVLIV